MKNTSKIIAMLLALVLALAMTVPAFAAVASSEVTAVAGETVTVEFKYEDIKAIGGTITYSNEALFTDVDVTCQVGDGFLYNKATSRVAWYDTEPSSPVLTLTIVVAANANPGDTCDITFEYESSVDGTFPTEPVYVKETVTVKIKAGETPVVIDTTELEKQISIAEGLTESAYTPDSWANMIAVLKDAKAVLANPQTQEQVDAAAKALATAIAALVEVQDDPNPPTSDNSSVIMMTVVLVSGIALAGALVCKKKKAVK